MTKLLNGERAVTGCSTMDSEERDRGRLFTLEIEYRMTLTNDHPTNSLGCLIETHGFQQADLKQAFSWMRPDMVERGQQ